MIPRILEYRPKWWYKLTKGKPWFRVQLTNKVHGAYALEEAYKMLSPDSRRRISIAHATYVPPVRSTEEIAEIVRKFAKLHPEAKRIFIRGNPTASVSDFTSYRRGRWALAPRGHFYPASDDLIWDTEIAPAHVRRKGQGHAWRTTEWLLYPTHARSDVRYSGIISLSRKRNCVSGGWQASHATTHEIDNFALDLKTGEVYFGRDDADTVLFRVNKNAVIDFVKRLVSLRKVKIGGKEVQLRFVTWEHAPTKLEFFDFLKV